MSYSSLYEINKEYYGEEICKYGNSWLFSPVIWDVLSDKYLPREWGMIQSIISLDGEEVHKQINNVMNESDNTCERVCWELSNQQIFFSKDKDIIADSIVEFADTHKQYNKSIKDNIGALEREHIIERFEQIANDIRSINEEEFPYFVFKNSSADDAVEYWFTEYDEEIGEYKDMTLSSLDECVAEFIVIKDGKIISFIKNTNFEY